MQHNHSNTIEVPFVNLSAWVPLRRLNEAAHRHTELLPFPHSSEQQTEWNSHVRGALLLGAAAITNVTVPGTLLLNAATLLEKDRVSGLCSACTKQPNVVNTMALSWQCMQPSMVTLVWPS